MKEHVSELTPAEFQQTFPIKLTEVTSEYADWYKQEEQNIRHVLGEDSIFRISHIGSTAVVGIKAKPMVDILMELNGDCWMDAVVESLKKIEFGTEVLRRKDNPFEILMAKGMTVNGFDQKVYLLHVRYAGDWKELYFRDYLLDHGETAREYSELKERILRDIHDGKIERMPNGKPSGYSEAKLDYVNDVSRKAKEEYGDRYKPIWNRP